MFSIFVHKYLIITSIHIGTTKHARNNNDQSRLGIKLSDSRPHSLNSDDLYSNNNKVCFIMS